MSKNVTMMEEKVSQSFSNVKKIQTNLVDGKTQNWVPEDEAYLYIKTKKLSVSKNGRYSIAEENEKGDSESSTKYAAYSEVKVKVADKKKKTVSKKITKNGSYSASDDNADAYSSVTVNVAGAIQQSKDYTYQWRKVVDDGYGENKNIYNRCIEYNGSIYVNNSDGVFKSFNGSVWTTHASVPLNAGSACIFVYQNKIHAISGVNQFYEWTGSAWVLKPSRFQSFHGSNTCAIEYQGKLHYFCYDGWNNYHSTFDGTNWTNETLSLSGKSIGYYAIYVFNDLLHVVLSDYVDYIWTGTGFERSHNWGGRVYTVGYSKVNDVLRVIGTKYVSNSKYRPYSYNGSFIRPEEYKGLRDDSSWDYGLESVTCSINETLYCIGRTSTFVATPIVESGGGQ